MRVLSEVEWEINEAIRSTAEDSLILPEGCVGELTGESAHRASPTGSVMPLGRITFSCEGIEPVEARSFGQFEPEHLDRFQQAISTACAACVRCTE